MKKFANFVPIPFLSFKTIVWLFFYFSEKCLSRKGEEKDGIPEKEVMHVFFDRCFLNLKFWRKFIQVCFQTVTRSKVFLLSKVRGFSVNI